MLMPVLRDVSDATGLNTGDIDFTCSGSSDCLAGRAFSFTRALDGVGARLAAERGRQRARLLPRKILAR